MTKEAHAVAVLQGALNEYFFYGRDVFERKRAMFEEIIHEARLEKWAYEGLRTWDDCVRSFRRSSDAYLRVQLYRQQEGRLDSSRQGEAKTSARVVTDNSRAKEE